MAHRQMPEKGPVERLVTYFAGKIHALVSDALSLLVRRAERLAQYFAGKRASGHGAQRQTNASYRPQRSVSGEFSKPYYLDMLVEHGVIYELKATDGMTGATTQQLVNYLMLCDLRHGKLVNFRPASVVSRYVSTRIDRQERMNFRLIADEYRDATDHVRKTLAALLSDWGAFLDVQQTFTSHTRLESIHWINFDHQSITIKTLFHDFVEK